MPDFRFVHAADIHLDSPLKGLESHEDAPVDLIRGATRKALENLVDLCLQEQVSFLLIAGDVYDGDWKSAETGRFFARQMLKLATAEPPIPVFLIKGNHDAESAISREMVVPSVQTFPSAKPTTVLIEGLRVAIHGQSYSHVKVIEDLSKGYPGSEPGYFNIGMLHTCASGRDGHDRYAPCNPQDLITKGYDYWALGHVHTRETLSTSPYIVFPGNIQGRHVRETAKEGKGCSLVTVSSGQVSEVRHVPLDVIRWDILAADVTGAQTELDVIERIASVVSESAKAADGRLLAVRLHVVGQTSVSLEIHRDLSRFTDNVRERVIALPDDVWIEDILVEVQNQFELDPDSAVMGLVASIRSASKGNFDSAYQEKVLPLVVRLRTSAPGLLAELGLDSPDLMKDLIPEIEQAILAVADGIQSK